MNNNPEISLPVGAKEVGLSFDLRRSILPFIAGNVLVHGVIESGVTPIDKHGPQLTTDYVLRTDFPPPPENQLPPGAEAATDYHAVPIFKDGEVYGHAYDPGLDSFISTFRSPKKDEIASQEVTIYEKTFNRSEVLPQPELNEVEANIRQLSTEYTHTPNDKLVVKVFGDVNKAEIVSISDGSLIMFEPKTKGPHSMETTRVQMQLNEFVNSEKGLADKQILVEPLPRTDMDLKFGEYKSLMELMNNNGYESFGSMVMDWRAGNKVPAQVVKALDTFQAKYNDEFAGKVKIELVHQSGNSDTPLPKDSQVCIVPVIPAQSEPQPVNLTIPVILPLLVMVPFARRRRLKSPELTGLDQDVVMPSRKQHRKVAQNNASIRESLEVERYDQVLELKADAKKRVKETGRVFKIPRRFWAFNAGVLALSAAVVGGAKYIDSNKTHNNNPNINAIDNDRQPCSADMEVLYERRGMGK